MEFARINRIKMQKEDSSVDGEIDSGNLFFVIRRR